MRQHSTPQSADTVPPASILTEASATANQHIQAEEEAAIQHRLQAVLACDYAPPLVDTKREILARFVTHARPPDKSE